jgi:drug/metabolite transporter (DMT)-like permease
MSQRKGQKETSQLVEETHEHVEKADCTPAGAITFVLGLISGTFSALGCKFAYDTSAAGIDGTDKVFAKPIMMLFLMFLAMSPAMGFWLFQQYQLPPSERDRINYSTMAILIVPSICDLLCTLLLLVAQLYITASLWQMLRGSIIIITALLKSFALNHRLRIHMWLGVGVITVAMVLVASTTLFQSTDATATSKDPRIGVLLVIVGCIAQGVQYVFEEKVMNVNNAPPLVVIGCEGLWGTFLTLTVVYPLSYYLPGNDGGHFENPFDAIVMIQNSGTLQMLVCVFVLFVTIYNCAAVYVTKYLSAIWHAILDNFRPITIWGFGLMIHSMGSKYGEVWVSASWLQLAGLIVLLFGTAVYNGSIITFDDENSKAYSLIDDMEIGQTQHGHVQNAAYNHSQTGLIKTEKAMASPALQRSPLIYQQQEEEAILLRQKKDRSDSMGSYQQSGVAEMSKSMEIDSNLPPMVAKVDTSRNNKGSKK